MSHFLYRHYDENDELLYIGISLDAITRQGAHERLAGWFPSVRRIEITVYPNKAEAARAEIQAIQLEQPRWNQQHHPAPEKPPIAESRKGAALLRRLRASQLAGGGREVEKRLAEGLAGLAALKLSNKGED
jgi:excinuclease UvrABC nuclease subunit